MSSTLLVCLSIALLVNACASSERAALPARAPAPWPDAQQPVLRVGGELALQTRAEAGIRDGESLVIYRCESCTVDTPLPQGYPPPTPPGAIELKLYPLVRRAELRDVQSPDMAFFPLLAHITSRKIAMTSPVEVDYSAGPDGVQRETMSFLYRRPEQGPTGATESKVVVRDLPELHVLALGVRGEFGVEVVEEALARLREFLAAHPEWTEAGTPRSLQYNSPFVRPAERWAEVQIPVRPRG